MLVSPLYPVLVDQVNHSVTSSVKVKNVELCSEEGNLYRFYHFNDTFNTTDWFCYSNCGPSTCTESHTVRHWEENNLVPLIH
jgi:hypothetical protein